jgi:site-specific DNA-methyltransferase (adenine-specific)
MPAVAAPSLTLQKPLKLSQHLFAKGKGFSLYQGDALALMDQMEAGSFDVIFADPPYFLSNGGFTCKGGKRAPVGKGGWDRSKGIEDDHKFTTAWLAACQRLLKPSGTIWVSGTQHVIFSVGFAMQTLGYKLLNTVTWYKPNASPNLSCRYFTHSTELLIWAAPKSQGKLQHTFHYKAMKAANGGKQMRDVWALPKGGEEELDADGEGRVWSQLTPRKSEKAFGGHPTQKPIALLERILQASCPDGGKVLDPFNGSGTTGVATLKHGGNYVGLDLSEEYLTLSEKRLTNVSRCAS